MQRECLHQQEQFFLLVFSKLNEAKTIVILLISCVKTNLKEQYKTKMTMYSAQKVHYILPIYVENFMKAYSMIESMTA